MAKSPFENLRVIDSTYVFAMPYAGGILGDMGAEVIKIEGPGHLDIVRGGQFSGGFPDEFPDEFLGEFSNEFLNGVFVGRFALFY